MAKRRIVLCNTQSPGDIVMLTAAVRDLYISHHQDFEIQVDTSCQSLWEHNPYLTPFDTNASDVERIECEYPLIHKSNTAPYHFIHGFRMDLEEKLGVSIPATAFKGDIHLSHEEINWMSQIEEMGVTQKYWIMMAGGKLDYTAKWWNSDSYQKVVDHFKGRIIFVQCGEKNHWHPPLKGVINMIGKTDLRQFVRLIYHSIGVVCPVTFAMHAVAAIPLKDGPRGCVVVAGGREPAQWEAYPNHRYLSTNGALSCCDNGGCWKSRCQKLDDGSKHDDSLCVNPVTIQKGIQIAKCMDMIKPFDVIRAIELFYEGGVLAYN